VSQGRCWPAAAATGPSDLTLSSYPSYSASFPRVGILSRAELMQTRQKPGLVLPVHVPRYQVTSPQHPGQQHTALDEIYCMTAELDSRQLTTQSMATHRGQIALVQRATSDTFHVVASASGEMAVE